MKSNLNYEEEICGYIQAGLSNGQIAHEYDKRNMYVSIFKISRTREKYMRGKNP